MINNKISSRKNTQLAMLKAQAGLALQQESLGIIQNIKIVKGDRMFNRGLFGARFLSFVAFLFLSFSMQSVAMDKGYVSLDKGFDVFGLIVDGNITVLRWLCENGLDVDKSCCSGKYLPINAAIAAGKFDIVRLFASFGAKFDQNSMAIYALCQQKEISEQKVKVYFNVGTPEKNSLLQEKPKPECSICLEEMDSAKGNVICLDCMTHMFHKNCLGRWFKDSGQEQKGEFECPICKTKAETYKKNREFEKNC